MTVFLLYTSPDFDLVNVFATLIGAQQHAERVHGGPYEWAFNEPTRSWFVPGRAPSWTIHEYQVS